MDEIKIRILSTDTTYPFPYLVTELYRAAEVPNIIGVDKNICAQKTHNPIGFDEVYSGLRLDRGAKVAVDPPIIDAGEVHHIDVEDFLAQEASVPETEAVPSVSPAAIGSSFQLVSIRKVANQAKWCKEKLYSFANHFAAALYKRIKDPLEPFVTLPARVVDLENRFDARTKKMIGADLVAFKVH